MVTVRLDPPELVMVAGWLWAFPTFTMPKLIVPGETVTLPGLVLFVVVVVDDLLALLRPWQPSIVARARSTTSAFQRAGSCLIIEDPVALPDLLVRAEELVSSLDLRLGRSRKDVPRAAEGRSQGSRIHSSHMLIGQSE